MPRAKSLERRPKEGIPPLTAEQITDLRLDAFMVGASIVRFAELGGESEDLCLIFDTSYRMMKRWYPWIPSETETIMSVIQGSINQAVDCATNDDIPLTAEVISRLSRSVMAANIGYGIVDTPYLSDFYERVVETAYRLTLWIHDWPDKPLLGEVSGQRLELSYDAVRIEMEYGVPQSVVDALIDTGNEVGMTRGCRSDRPDHPDSETFIAPRKGLIERFMEGSSR